ncbi:MAG: zinc ribbon domain-containing protein [Desulfatiglandaceae bacterium]
MPIYEYSCLSCGRNFQLLVLNRRDVEAAVCPSCGGGELKRLISRTSYHRSERDRLESFDPAQPQGDGFYSDTRNIGLGAKKRAERMGVDLGGEFESKLDRLRSDPGRVFDDGD